jgi:hypothetical protein
MTTEIKAPPASTGEAPAPTFRESLIDEPKKTIKAKAANKPSSYERLTEIIPEEYHVRIERDNIVLTGYPGQIAIDRLNEIFGLEGWLTRETVLKQEIINGAWVVAMKLELIIGEDDKEIIRTGYGAMYAKRVEDAYGGAFTSALKRAVRQLGIGRELYLRGEEDLPTKEATQVASLGVAEIIDTVADDVKALMEKINSATNSEQLESLTASVTALQGEAVQKLVFNKFNAKKLSLQTNG